MVKKWSKLQREVSTLQEKHICVESLWEEAKIHGFPSSLATRTAELDSSLEMEKKYQMDIVTILGEMKSRAGKALRSLQQHKESQDKDCEAYEDWVDGLRKEVNESLQKTCKRVYESFNQAAVQVKALHRDLSISNS